MSIFPPNTIDTVTGGIVSAISQNIGVILGVFAVIVGVSIIMAIFDEYGQRRWLEDHNKRWKQ